MKKEDLDKTIPIDILGDDSLKRTRYENNEEMYDELEELEIQEENKTLEDEILEEMEQTKEIDNLQDLMDEEKKEEDSYLEKKIDEVALIVKDEEEKSKKKNVFVKLKDKFMNMSKKNKILCGVLFGLFIVLIIVLIILLLVGGKEEEKPKLEPEVDETPVIVDNYYYKKGKLYFINEEKKELGSYECTNKDEDTCYVAINANVDNLDVPVKLNHEGSIINERTNIVNEDLVLVYDSENAKSPNINLYSIKEEKVVDSYKSVKTYKDNYVIVNKENKYGLIKLEDVSKELIKTEFDELYMIDGVTNLLGKDSEGYVILDQNGAKLSKPFDKDLEIVYFNNSFVVTKEVKTYSVYNYNAEELAYGYDFATVYDTYMMLVKDNKVFVRDVTNNKYNEVGYKLENSTYVKKSNYDKDGKFVSKEQSFEMLKSEELVQLLVYKGDEPQYYNIDIAQAAVNTKYSYMNYFDGKLYFYKDIAKQELIGKVTCSNQNEISKSSDSLNKCNVATDTIYEKNDVVSNDMLNRKSTVPIILGKYVFIKDGSDVKLYDLTSTSTKPKGTYASVSSYTANNSNAITHVNSNISMIVSNKKGKFALVRLSANSIDVAISFDYTAMEMVGEFIVAKKSDTVYDIFLSGDDTALVSISGKMVGYSSDKKYIKYMNGNSYVVADIQGNDVTSTKYDYVELYKDYYVGIKDKKLNIYDYKGSKITKEELTVGDYGYVRTNTPAFKVSKVDSNYNVSIYNGKGYDEHTYYVDRNTYKPEEVVPEQPETPGTGEENSGS